MIVITYTRHSVSVSVKNQESSKNHRCNSGVYIFCISRFSTISSHCTVSICQLSCDERLVLNVGWVLTRVVTNPIWMTQYGKMSKLKHLMRVQWTNGWPDPLIFHFNWYTLGWTCRRCNPQKNKIFQSCCEKW